MNMNPSWLQQVQNESLIGKQVEILECQHVDIRPGQKGVVKNRIADGYAVETTGIFAKDIQNCQQETRTETVFVEANKLRLVDCFTDL